LSPGQAGNSGDFAAACSTGIRRWVRIPRKGSGKRFGLAPD
jgi:hypothetical protein